ncbi:MAG: sugar transferase [Actinobacteria bacterium]|nr:sugar transferase [Actinomycetota bacterium]
MFSLSESSHRLRRKLWTFIFLISDILMLALAFRFSFYLRFQSDLLSSLISEPALSVYFYTRTVYFLVPLIILVFYFYKLYDWHHLLGGSGEYTRVITAATISLFMIILLGFMIKIPAIARGWLLTAWISTSVFVVVARFLLRRLIYEQRKKGIFLSRTVIVGANEEGKTIAEEILKSPISGLKMVGFVDEKWEIGAEVLPAIPVIGETSQLRKLLENNLIETVIFVSSAFSHLTIVRMIQSLRGYPLDILLSSGLFEILLSRVTIKEVSSIPLIGVRSVSLSKSALVTKRIFDLIVSFLALVVLSPFLLIVSLIIKLTSAGSVIYVSKRVGKDGKLFNFYKFRTMYEGADKKLNELEKLNEAEGHIFKIKNDPRITNVGKFLRKFSIDELPQLINVLKGEMSLVGPRPPIPSEVIKYDDWHLKRLDVTPGMTGLWQVSGRSSLTFDEMVRMDLFYIENWSLAFDIKILLKTIRVVLFASGAY